MKITILILSITLFSGISNVIAQDKSTVASDYSLLAQPLIEQCDELKETDDPSLAKLLAELSQADGAGKIRLAEAVGKSCHKKSSSALLPLLQDSDPMVRIAAIKALGKLGDADAIDPLIEITNDKDWRVLYHLGPVLCSFQKQNPSYAALNFIAVTGTLSEVTENNVRARGNAIIAVNQLRDVSFSRKTIPLIFSFLDHKDEQVKKVAEEIIRALKDTRNGKYELIGTLKQSINPNFRRNSAYWIGELKIQQGRQLLTDVAASDTDVEVKKIAAEALKKLGPLEE